MAGRSLLPMSHPACMRERKKEPPMNTRDKQHFTTASDTALAFMRQRFGVVAKESDKQ